MLAPMNRAFSTIILSAFLSAASSITCADPPLLYGEGGSGSGTSGTSEAGTTTSSSTTSTTTGVGSSGSTTDESDSETQADPPEPACGNGVLEAGEECDDGMANAPDGECTPTCMLGVCGDGVIIPGVEECDLGPLNLDYGLCTTTCTTARCGDGLLQPENGEECDDGNASDDDACTHKCKIKGGYCGDGILQDGEACDDGNGFDLDGCKASCELTPRRVFVSPEAVTTAQIAGDPDALCAGWASQLKLKGATSEFRALLAMPDFWSRMEALPGARYVRVDHVDLFTATDVYPGDLPTLLLPIGIYLDAAGNDVGPGRVWTGIDGNGVGTAACSGWTSSEGFAGAGLTLSGKPGPTNYEWVHSAIIPCSDPARIYCVEVYG